MVVGFTTTCAITYHQYSCEFESRSWQGVLNTTLIYVMKFVSDLRQVGGFLQVLQFPPTGRHDMIEILLKVMLNTITLTPKNKKKL